MFGDKGLRARTILGNSDGTVGEWAKLGVRGATVVVGTSANNNEAEVDYLCSGSNDHITIKNAIDSLPTEGGMVLLLEGTYNFGGDLLCSKNNVTIRGCGTGTVLKLNTSIPLDTAMVRITGQNCTLCDVKIQGNGMKNDGYTAAVDASGSYNRILNVEATACSGVSGTTLRVIQTGNYGTISGCYIHDCYSNGDLRAIEAGSNCKITDNRCMNNGGKSATYGIYCRLASTQVSGNHITGNHCDADSDSTDANAKSYGIYLYGSRCTVTNNSISQTNSSHPLWGIYVYGSNHAIHSNSMQNLIATPTMAGIEVTDDYNSIVGNVFWGNIGSATEMAHIKVTSSYNTIVGNTSEFNSTNSQVKPILLTATAKNNTVVGNRIKGSDVIDNNTDTANPNVVGFNNDSPAGGSLANVDVPDAGYVQIGKDASTLTDLDGSGVAIGKNASAISRGIAIGEDADVTGTGGVAVGSNASVDGPGGAIGLGADACTGGAVGWGATANNGGAVGWNAEVGFNGGAVGQDTKTNSGGAIGCGAQSGYGFAGGYNAKAGDSSSPIDFDAIQLGTGTNTASKTLQVYNYQLMDASGKIPAERLPGATINVIDPTFVQNSSGDWVETTDLDNLSNGVTMVNYRDYTDLGGYLVLTATDISSGGYGLQIKISRASTQYRMVISVSSDGPSWSAWTAQG